MCDERAGWGQLVRGGLYKAAQVVWGLPQTFAGLGVFLACATRPHYRFHGAIVTTWKWNRALSLGMFVFLRGFEDEGGLGSASSPDEGPYAPEDAAWGVPGAAGATRQRQLPDVVDCGLLVHEYGHTVQSLVLGPLYLPVIGLPSVIWLNLPACAHLRRSKGISYYEFYTERSANWLGERVLKQPSMGFAHID